MKMYVYQYSALTYGRMVATDGELAVAHENDIKNTIGIIHLSGATECVESDNLDNIGQGTDEILVLKPIVKNCTRFISKCIGDTEWVCLNDNGLGLRNVTVQSITDSYVLPAGTAFIVLQGQFMADGFEAVQDDYFRPRAGDITITGNGTIILIQ